MTMSTKRKQRRNYQDQGEEDLEVLLLQEIPTLEEANPFKTRFNHF